MVFKVGFRGILPVQFLEKSEATTCSGFMAISLSYQSQFIQTNVDRYK
jgi:hypothetical protein